MPRRWIHIFAVLCLAASGVLAAAPVALITELDGVARRAQGPGAAALAVRAPLSKNEVLNLGDGARLVAAFTESGAVVEAHGPGRVRVAAATLLPLDARLRVLTRDPLAALRQLRIAPAQAVQASIVMRSGVDEAAHITAPTGAVTMAQARTLQWHSAAAIQRAELIDASGRSVAQFEAPVGPVELAASLTLERGRPYVWTLVTTEVQEGSRRSEPVAVEFVIVDARTEAALADLARRAARDPTSRMLHAIAIEGLRGHTAAQARIAAR